MEADLIWEDRGQGFRLDLSRMGIPSAFRTAMQGPLQRALAAMRELERGAVANPDEGRMVGHYWLRAPELAPSMAIAAEIHETLEKVLTFARDVESARSPAGSWSETFTLRDVVAADRSSTRSCLTIGLRAGAYSIARSVVTEISGTNATGRLTSPRIGSA